MGGEVLGGGVVGVCHGEEIAVDIPFSFPTLDGEFVKGTVGTHSCKQTNKSINA